MTTRTAFTKLMMGLGGLALALGLAFGQYARPAPTDDQIRQYVVNWSVAQYLQYRGNCPCPFNTDSAGHSCGARSSWSKRGGVPPPYCFPGDVPQETVNDVREHGH
jgi:hypothetical protein